MAKPEFTTTTTLMFKLVLVFQQNIEEIPSDLKQLYKTVWEISQKMVLKMAADRGAYIDQSQSLNIHIAEPNYGKLTSMHFFGWKQVSWGRLGQNGHVLEEWQRGGQPADFPSCLLPRFPQGLKTGMYYLRTKPAANPIQFTLNKEKLKEGQEPVKASEEEAKERNMAAMVCSLQNRDECLMCGS